MGCRQARPPGLGTGLEPTSARLAPPVTAAISAAAAAKAKAKKAGKKDKSHYSQAPTR
jgi:hypothetical protein